MKFFRNKVARHDAPDVNIRYHAAVHAEFALNVMTALGGDCFWTDLVLKVDRELMSCLEKWEAEGFPGLPVIDVAEAAPVQISYIGRRSRDVRAASEDRNY